MVQVSFFHLILQESTKLKKKNDSGLLALPQSAGSFALFMGVGSALRCEGLPAKAQRNL